MGDYRVHGKVGSPEELLDRVTLSGGGGTSLSEDPRVRIWTRGVELFWKRPILGYGTGSFFTVAADDNGVKRAPHNIFISVGVELGIVGLVLYLIYLALLFCAAWRLPTGKSCCGLVSCR